MLDSQRMPRHTGPVAEEIMAHEVRMEAVDADLLESIGYEDGSRMLHIKFRNSPALCFQKVPRFRYEGLLAAPRKDAYYKSFIQNKFNTRPA